MSTPVARIDRYTGFVADADTRCMFRVPADLFPMPVDVPAVPAVEAGFVRPSDWVVGVRIGSEARCYPTWIADNFHALNDTLAGVPIVVVHCEICSSSTAYLAEHRGERLLFRTAGLFGGILTMADQHTGSLWPHGPGVAVEGPLRGTVLPLLQSFQATYAEWLALHPETTVMTWPAPAVHPDGRHGHGWEMTFSIAGMDPKAVATMAAPHDPRLPENEIVLSISCEAVQAVLPLRELLRAGGVFAFEVTGLPLVALSNGATSALCGVFHREVEGGGPSGLEFASSASRIVDRQTGSTWRADGLATAGPLAGRRLTPFPTVLCKWHSLTCFQPAPTILRHAGTPAPVDVGGAESVLEGLRDAGLDAEVVEPLQTLALPDGATTGLRVRLDGDPFELLCFADAAAAEDTAPSRAERSGALVLASDPEVRFEDERNSRPLPDERIAWSPLLGTPRLREAVERASLTAPGEATGIPSITALVARLAQLGFPGRVTAPTYRDVIPPGARNACFVELAGDPFLVYRFLRPADATAFAASCGHALAAAAFVLRSDPSDLYALGPTTWTLRRPDEQVSWSPLLRDPRFHLALRAASSRAGSWDANWRDT